MKLFCIIFAFLMLFATMATGEEGKVEEIKLNINETTIDELVELPGIGPVKAKAIVDYRDLHGDFEKITDLLKIKGIGEKGLAKIVGLITVGDAKKKEMARRVKRSGKLATVWARIKFGR